MTAPLPYRLRLFRDSDGDIVCHLIQATIDACYTGVYPPQAVAFFKQHHSAANILQRARQGTTLVAEMDGRIVATGSIIGDHIQGVFVAPQLQRRGLGRALMARLEALARQAGVTTALLDVSLPSRRFYEQMGCRVTQAARIDVGGAQTLDYWKATKALSESSV